MLTLLQVSLTGTIQAKKLLFEEMSKKEPQRFGHLGKGFQNVDRVIDQASREVPEESRRWQEWRIVAVYQLAALQGLFSRLLKQEKRSQTNSQQQDLQLVYLEGVLSRLDPISEKIASRGAIDQLPSIQEWRLFEYGTVLLQNALMKLLELTKLEDGIWDFEGLSEAKRTAIAMKRRLYPNGRDQKRIDLIWSHANFKVLQHGLSCMECALAGTNDLSPKPPVGSALGHLPSWDPVTTLEDLASALGLSELLSKDSPVWIPGLVSLDEASESQSGPFKYVPEELSIPPSKPVEDLTPQQAISPLKEANSQNLSLEAIALALSASQRYQEKLKYDSSADPLSEVWKDEYSFGSYVTVTNGNQRWQVKSLPDEPEDMETTKQDPPGEEPEGSE